MEMKFNSKCSPLPLAPAAFQFQCGQALSLLAGNGSNSMSTQKEGTWDWRQVLALGLSSSKARGTGARRARQGSDPSVVTVSREHTHCACTWEPCGFFGEAAPGSWGIERHLTPCDSISLSFRPRRVSSSNVVDMICIIQLFL